MYIYNYLDVAFTSEDQTVWYPQIKQGIMSSRANNSVNFQQIFTNEGSKFKLRFSLSTNLYDFRADTLYVRSILNQSGIDIKFFYDFNCFDVLLNPTDS